ncbi:MAG: glutathione S-transferase family protein [Gammaproteobacteria bacterium]|nr:glutathione S-transferase family protein [Gammaproteobacteria bacterium]
MKLHNSVGPNPKVVRMFMAERGLEIALQEVDLMGGENRQDAYLKINPAGQLPALELDNGDVITEITVICEYLDEKEGSSSLIGTNPEERGETRMWVRRIDHGVMENLANGFRYSDGAALFKDRMRLIPQAADDLKALAQEKVTWLDGLMEGKQYICGDRFSLADIVLFVFLEFGAQVGQPLNADNKNIMAWFERVKERSSASA